MYNLKSTSKSNCIIIDFGSGVGSIDRGRWIKKKLPITKIKRNNGRRSTNNEIEVLNKTRKLILAKQSKSKNCNYSEKCIKDTNAT